MEIVERLQINRVIKIIIISLLGTLLLTISAKVKIPFFPVPMTMQTFVVLLIGITLGSKVGLFTISLYLLEGIFGLPVFANSPEKGIGLIYFTGPTMGYLVGFLFAAYIAGNFKYYDIFQDKFFNFFKNYFKLLIAVFFIYFIGLIWLGFLIGWNKPIFQIGDEPFLLAESFKIFLLAIVAGKLSNLRKFI